MGEVDLWDMAFADLVQQVFVHCAERGNLLQAVRSKYYAVIDRLTVLRDQEIAEKEKQFNERLRQLEQMYFSKTKNSVMFQRAVGKSKQEHLESELDSEKASAFEFERRVNLDLQQSRTQLKVLMANLTDERNRCRELQEALDFARSDAGIKQNAASREPAAEASLILDLIQREGGCMSRLLSRLPDDEARTSLLSKLVEQLDASSRQQLIVATVERTMPSAAMRASLCAQLLATLPSPETVGVIAEALMLGPETSKEEAARKRLLGGTLAMKLGDASKTTPELLEGLKKSFKKVKSDDGAEEEGAAVFRQQLMLRDRKIQALLGDVEAAKQRLKEAAQQSEALQAALLAAEQALAAAEEGGKGSAANDEAARQQKMLIRMLRAEAQQLRASMLEAAEKIGGLEAEMATQQQQLWEAEERLAAAAENERLLQEQLQQADIASASAAAAAAESSSRADKQAAELAERQRKKEAEEAERRARKARAKGKKGRGGDDSSDSEGEGTPEERARRRERRAKRKADKEAQERLLSEQRELVSEQSALIGKLQAELEKQQRQLAQALKEMQQQRQQLEEQADALRSSTPGGRRTPKPGHKHHATQTDGGGGGGGGPADYGDVEIDPNKSSGYGSSDWQPKRNQKEFVLNHPTRVGIHGSYQEAEHRDMSDVEAHLGDLVLHASGHKAMSLPVLHKMVALMFSSKIVEDRKQIAKGLWPMPLPDYVAFKTNSQYGVKRMAHKYLNELAVGLHRHRHKSVRLATFARACSLFEGESSSYEQNSLLLDIYRETVGGMAQERMATRITNDSFFQRYAETKHIFIPLYYFERGLAQALGHYNHELQLKVREGMEAYLEKSVFQTTSDCQNYTKDHPHFKRALVLADRVPGGFVCFDECIAEVHKLHASFGRMRQQQMHFLFAKFDLNEDGIFDHKEFVEMIHAIAPTLSAHAVDSMYKTCLQLDPEGIKVHTIEMVLNDTTLRKQLSTRTQAAKAAQGAAAPEELARLGEQCDADMATLARLWEMETEHGALDHWVHQWGGLQTTRALVQRAVKRFRQRKAAKH